MTNRSDDLFEFADDKFTALASPRLVGQSDLLRGSIG
jgi:hypothetical protein